MHTDHRAQVEEMLAEYRRSRDQLGTIQQELAGIAETAASEDRTVEVTVDSRGVLNDMRLTDEAYRKHSPSELAALIVRLSGDAAGAASARVRGALEPALPAGADPAAVLDGRADLAPARSTGGEVADGVAVTPRTASEEDSDADGGEHSWLQGSLSSNEARTHRSGGSMRS